MRYSLPKTHPLIRTCTRRKIDFSLEFSVFFPRCRENQLQRSISEALPPSPPSPTNKRTQAALTSSIRYSGAGLTAWVARLSASPTRATCPPLRDPGPLHGLVASGFTCTDRPSLTSRDLSSANARKNNIEMMATSRTRMVCYRMISTPTSMVHPESEWAGVDGIANG